MYCKERDSADERVNAPPKKKKKEKEWGKKALLFFKEREGRDSDDSHIMVFALEFCFSASTNLETPSSPILSLPRL